MPPIKSLQANSGVRCFSSMKMLWVVALAVLLGLSACGGGSSDDAEANAFVTESSAVAEESPPAVREDETNTANSQELADEPAAIAEPVRITNVQNGDFPAGPENIDFMVEEEVAVLRFVLNGKVVAEYSNTESERQPSTRYEHDLQAGIGRFLHRRTAGARQEYRFVWNTETSDEGEYVLLVEVVTGVGDEISTQSYDVVIDRSAPRLIHPSRAEVASNVGLWSCGELLLAFNEKIAADSFNPAGITVSNQQGEPLAVVSELREAGTVLAISLDNPGDGASVLSVNYRGALADAAGNRLSDFVLDFDMHNRPQTQCGAANAISNSQLFPVFTKADDGSEYASWLLYSAETGRYEVWAFSKVAGQWQAHGSTLSVDTASKPSRPKIAVYQGQPVVAFTEYNSSTGSGAVYVQHFDGNAWQVLGGSSINNAQFEDISAPDMVAGRNGSLYVTWTEYVDSLVEQDAYVKQWQGEKWVQLGESAELSRGNSAEHVAISLHPDTGEPLLVYAETRAGKFLRGLTVLWRSGRWVGFGPSFSAAGEADYFSLDSVAGRTVMSWSEVNSSMAERHVYVAELSADGWVRQGEAVNADGSFASNPDIRVSADGRRSVGFQYRDASGSGIRVYDWADSQWLLLGSVPQGRHPQLILPEEGFDVQIIHTVFENKQNRLSGFSVSPH